MDQSGEERSIKIKEKTVKKNFVVSSSPHIFNSLSTPNIMWGVVIALIPVTAASIIFFKMNAVRLLISCVIGCVATEVIIQKLQKKKITIYDGSAVVTGLLLCMVLPPSLPVWTALFASVVAIGLCKQLFGGLGYNIFNPALLARAFLVAAFPAFLTRWNAPFTLDAITGATPLGAMKFEYVQAPIMNLFFGNVAGSLGETSALAIIIGSAYLFIKKYADWRIPLSFILTASLLGAVLGIINPSNYPTVLFHVLSGGLLLGALFMATDPVTSPVTKKGRWIFGIGCGLLTIVIRTWSGLPEGVMYSILLMNGVTPLINKFTKPKRFGAGKIKI